MGWEHKLIVLLHTVILVTVPDSTFLPRVKWKLQIHVVMKQFQYEHSAKNYKVGKTQSCVTAGWEGSELIKASSSLEEPFRVYWNHSASVWWMYIGPTEKLICYDISLIRRWGNWQKASPSFQEILFLCNWRFRKLIWFALSYTRINSYIWNWAWQEITGTAGDF